MINENELFDHFIIELEGSTDHKRHRLSKLWEELFATMDSAHSAIIKEDIKNMVEGRAKGKKPILSRLTGFANDMLVLPAFSNQLQCSLTLPGIIGDILIKYPKVFGFSTCRSCQYPVPRGGDKLPACPVCGSLL